MKTRSYTLVALAMFLGAAGLTADDEAKEKDAETPGDQAEKDVPAALDFKVKDIEGTEVALSRYQGAVVLIVNVASRCGATPQYKDLQALYEKYHEQGLVILGFPCNQFGGQEPGTEAQIAEFCQSTYDVTFPLFSKIDVNGEDRAKLYEHLTSEDACPRDPGPVKWNFEKFLLGRDGAVVARYRTKVKPRSENVVETIETELRKEAP